MPARRVKTFYKELGHRAHREHRSKKGRRRNYGKIGRQQRLEFKKIKEQTRLSELDKEAILTKAMYAENRAEAS